MDEYIAVYIYDVKKAIEEMESYFVDYPMRYDVFKRVYPFTLTKNVKWGKRV